MNKRYALVSVFTKIGLQELAEELIDLGYTLLSTGGTAEYLRKKNLAVVEVSDYTQYPEMMGGRVKTLHPKIHGGLLARLPEDKTILMQQAIVSIDILIVNLYPFQEVILRPEASLSEAVENIDIGGPAMLRSAAKNYERVTVIVDPKDYSSVLKELRATGQTLLSTRFALAKKVFSHTAQYDAAIAQFFSTGQNEPRFPEVLNLSFRKAFDLRYGENPHQASALYTAREAGLNFEILQGKALSYNNFLDVNAALESLKLFKELVCVIIKHTNPCGIALGAIQKEAYQKAYGADPTSAFGGILAFNTPLEVETAELILNQFVEIVIAPFVSASVLSLFSHKPDVRVLQYNSSLALSKEPLAFHFIEQGLLAQTPDHLESENNWKIVTTRQPTTPEWEDLRFAWKVSKLIKSNGIVLAKAGQTLGLGIGQTSRVMSVDLALLRSKQQNFSLEGAVMASDAFFPFRDSIDKISKTGVTAIIQPGGSRRDSEVTAAAEEHHLAMVMTGTRHFKH